MFVLKIEANFLFHLKFQMGVNSHVASHANVTRRQSLEPLLARELSQ